MKQKWTTKIEWFVWWDFEKCIHSTSLINDTCTWIVRHVFKTVKGDHRLQLKSRPLTINTEWTREKKEVRRKKRTTKLKTSLFGSWWTPTCTRTYIDRSKIWLVIWCYFGDLKCCGFNYKFPFLGSVHNSIECLMPVSAYAQEVFSRNLIFNFSRLIGKYNWM